MSCIVHPVFDLKTEIRDLININELSVDFDLQVKYFLYIQLLGNLPDFRDLVYIFHAVVEHICRE